MFSFLILLGLVLLFIFWVVAIYNGLIAARNAYKNAFAQIDVQLQRRFELIPNLVEIAKRYMAHERETLEAVMTARSAAMSGAAAAKSVPGDPAAMARLGSSEGVLGGALGRLMMVAEAYPELQANQTMRELTEELRSTENRVAFSRQAYNDGVTVYNNRREVFPASLIAGNCGFRPAGLLAIPSAEAEMRQSPKVAF
ncbi:LemA family protein [Lysobacter avium]|uniref:LemA family protein n=2 Tax=Novilysobacter avium TaxID=2781023 RepID=A0A7S6UN98_9GAMM|nr:LemA family protein [Lysobacter avium]